MRFLSVALIFALTPFSLHAADAAQAGGQCPACEPSVAFAEASADLRLADATFLGLITEPISLERAGDLNLPAGTGLSVLRVAPGSPAAKAGFQTGDVLAKLDDQILVNPAQLRVLVRNHGAADTLAFQVIRKGKAQVLKTGLATQKLPELSPGGEEPRMFFPQNGSMHVMPFSHGELPPEILRQMPKEFRERMERMHRLPSPAGKNKAQDDDGKDDAAASGEITLDGSASLAPGNLAFSSRVVSNDGAHTIEIEHGAREHLRITDKDGKELYNGAMPGNDKEWDKVPQDVRGKAKAMAHATRPVRVDGSSTATEGKNPQKADETPGKSF